MWMEKLKKQVKLICILIFIFWWCWIVDIPCDIVFNVVGVLIAINSFENVY